MPPRDKHLLLHVIQTPLCVPLIHVLFSAIPSTHSLLRTFKISLFSSSFWWSGEACELFSPFSNMGLID